MHVCVHVCMTPSGSLARLLYHTVHATLEGTDYMQVAESHRRVYALLHALCEPRLLTVKALEGAAQNLLLLRRVDR